MEPVEYRLMDATEGGMWWYRALHRRMADALAGVSGRVLDAGCGTGGLLARLCAARPDLELIGLEWSPEAARRAAEKSQAAVVSGTINALPFADASLDAALCADVLCHAAVDPAAALAELRRVLRPGGTLAVNMPAYAWLMSAHDRRVHNARRQSAGEVRSMLARAGFSPRSVRYWNGLLLPFMVVQRKILARDGSASDVAPFSPRLDAAFLRATEIERLLPFPLPAGGSVIAIATRT